MRPSRKRASSPVEIMDVDEDGELSSVPEDEPQETAEAGTRLQFKQPLNWRAGKPIAVADLLRRLEMLSKELQGYEQDEVMRNSLLQTAGELASPQLLGHKDKGVKALTACCVVDMFRLCAPDAPYTQQQLKEIFTLIVSTIFPALADPSSAYNRQHLYVLKSLAEVKSIILLTDAPSSAKIIEALFKECFDVLGGPTKGSSDEELSKNVEHHMTVVLSTLVDESDTLSNEVTYTILAQFLRTSPKVAANGVGKGKKTAQVEEHQAKLTLKEAPPAYNMAKNICNASPEKMARNITRYWGSVVAEASASLPNGAGSTTKKGKRRVSDDLDDSDDELAKMANQDLEEITKAHDLLRELWRATPGVLRDIIPLLENELSEEHIQKRLLAVETVGDMIAGIGHAGPPTGTPLNPAAYPSQSLAEPSERLRVFDFMTTPTSPVSFMSRYHQIYQAFLSRRHDKSNLVRAAWATGVGRILLTSAGGVGLSTEEEQSLSRAFAECLMDTDEKVRHNAVKAIERFEFDDIVQKLGNRGGVDEPGSILSNLTERAKDRKQHVRKDALKLLGRIWGVAVGAIGEGSERITTLLGSIPSKILGVFYLNDLETNALADRIIYESLLPLTYPPIKTKAVTNGNSQRTRQSQGGEGLDVNPDKLRAERILLLVRGLDEKAKAVFFAICKKQTALAKFMDAFLKQCEAYNGGVVEDDEKTVKETLTKFLDYHAKLLPEPARASEDLWKFAKAHDRRTYVLIRFCMAAESDYKKVKNAFVELGKKLEEMPGTSPTFADNITLLVLRASVLVYNRSHVPAIIDFSRSDESGLSATAHEVLEKISKDKSEIFKAHIQDLCKGLEAEAPSAKKTNEPGAVQDLKACAQFARQFPGDVPKDRKFLQAMLSFIEHGSPPEAAKYGALIILLVAEKKQMYAKDIFQQCTVDFEYGCPNFLGRLAALSQLMLLGSDYIEDDEADAVVDIAIKQVLLNHAVTPAVDEADDPQWTDHLDENCAAKIWALKILTNRLRAYSENDRLDEAATPVFVFLNTLVQKQGLISKESPSPAAHQSRMRLVAAQLLLKLCREKHLSSRLSAAAFNSLSVVAMDARAPVRSGFVNKIMKYLGQLKLSNKFFTPLFLLGHEPDRSIKQSAMMWLKARGMQAERTKDTAMQATFARLLSLLAHHPDWPTPPVTDEEQTESLKEFMGYILFYLECVGTRENLSLVYHVAQRIKAHEDGIVDKAKKEMRAMMNERLYMLSDLSQGVIRKYMDVQGWTLQAWPGKVKLPNGIFMHIADHETGQEVAMKNYLPLAMQEDLDDLVRDALKSKKRKLGASNGEARKKTKADPERRVKKEKIAKPSSTKTPKKKRPSGFLSSEANAPSSDIRRSSRGANHKSYIEVSDEETSDVENAKVVEGEDGDEEMAEADEVEDEDDEEQVEEQSGPWAKEAEEEEPEVEIEEEQELPPMHSSPTRKKKGAAAPTPKQTRATPKKTPAAKSSSSPMVTSLPRRETRRSALKEKAIPAPKEKAKPAAKENKKPAAVVKEKPKANGTSATKGSRASKRGKAAVDEFDFPDSE